MASQRAPTLCDGAHPVRTRTGASAAGLAGPKKPARPRPGLAGKVWTGAGQGGEAAAAGSAESRNRPSPSNPGWRGWPLSPRASRGTVAIHANVWSRTATPLPPSSRGLGRSATRCLGGSGLQGRPGRGGARAARWNAVLDRSRPRSRASEPSCLQAWSESDSAPPARGIMLAACYAGLRGATRLGGPLPSPRCARGPLGLMRRPGWAWPGNH